MKPVFTSTLLGLFVLAGPALFEFGLAQEGATAAVLSKAEVLEDLAAFEKRLREEAAYLDLHQAKPFQAIDALRTRLPDSITAPEFARELRKTLSPIGDCHSSITCAADDDEEGLWLPFRLASAQGGIIAVMRDNRSFVEPSYPYLVAVDGRPLQDWLDAALKYEPVGSSSQNLYAALKGIRRLDILRRDLGLVVSAQVALVFANAEGESKERSLPCRDRFSSLAEIQLGESRLMDDIGYLRLPAMDDKLSDEARSRMESYRDTRGLIIDVRGNGGGRYGLMRTLFGYFHPPEAGPFVCNVAAYRLARHFKKNHIEYRPTHRRDWSGWSSEDLDAIDAVMKTFKPGFALAPGAFSDWHFMLLKRDTFHYHYDKPVIVLCDEKCISATDGFLAAFSSLPKVTLMGVGSRGGSGSSRTVKLPRSGIEFKLSTMASFRPDGSTFEGNGVSVDLQAQPPPEDFISGKDSVLEQAVRKLRNSSL